MVMGEEFIGYCFLDRERAAVGRIEQRDFPTLAKGGLIAGVGPLFPLVAASVLHPPADHVARVLLTCEGPMPRSQACVAGTTREVIASADAHGALRRFSISVARMVAEKIGAFERVPDLKTWLDWADEALVMNRVFTDWMPKIHGELATLGNKHSHEPDLWGAIDSALWATDTKNGMANVAASAFLNATWGVMWAAKLSTGNKGEADTERFLFSRDCEAKLVAILQPLLKNSRA
jgi:hypothetical protein